MELTYLITGIFSCEVESSVFTSAFVLNVNLNEQRLKITDHDTNSISVIYFYT